MSAARATTAVSQRRPAVQRGTPSRAHGVSPAPFGFIQRRCSCASAAGADGKCDGCRQRKYSGPRRSALPFASVLTDPHDRHEQEADRLAASVLGRGRPPSRAAAAPDGIQRAARSSVGGDAGGVAARPSGFGLDGPVSSSGAPLPASTRRFFEPRFGHDFGSVRVHTGERAARSAASIDAEAYTIGRDIVFGDRQFAPDTAGGQWLLAHELAHVVQQTAGRQAADPAGDMTYGPGESSKAYWALSATERSAVNAEVDRRFQERTGVTRPLDRKAPKDRALVRQWLRIRDEVMAERANAKPSPVCGPDVTDELSRTLGRVRSIFAGWSRDDKDAHCNALVKPPVAAFSWDIQQLHRNGWVLWYRCPTPSDACPVGAEVPKAPVCATWGASPACGSSVEVADQCYYAGSANYVVFGVMCDLCRQHYVQTPGTWFFADMQFTETEMLALVDLYKARGLAGSNWATARAWASAGYHGWPSGGSAPAADRANCATTCPTPYQGSQGADGGVVRDFEIVWCPRTGQTLGWAECESMGAAAESIFHALTGGQ